MHIFPNILFLFQQVKYLSRYFHIYHNCRHAGTSRLGCNAIKWCIRIVTI